MGRQYETEMTIVSQEVSDLTLEEICSVCDVPLDFVKKLIEHGMIEPVGQSEAEWHFPAFSVRVIRIANNLHQDLKVNPPGIALILELMNELEALRKKIEIMDKFTQS